MFTRNFWSLCFIHMNAGKNFTTLISDVTFLERRDVLRLWGQLYLQLGKRWSQTRYQVLWNAFEKRSTQFLRCTIFSLTPVRSIATFRLKMQRFRLNGWEGSQNEDYHCPNGLMYLGTFGMGGCSGFGSVHRGGIYGRLRFDGDHHNRRKLCQSYFLISKHDRLFISLGMEREFFRQTNPLNQPGMYQPVVIEAQRFQVEEVELSRAIQRLGQMIREAEKERS